MKIGFFSDLHLGAGRNLGYGEYGEGSRFLDQERVLDRMGDQFIADECGVVCFLGDAFHKPEPTPWENLAFQFFVTRLQEAGIELVIVGGNHEFKSPALPSALQMFKGKGVTVALSPRLIPFGDVVFGAMPWAPLSTLVAQEGRTANLRDTAIDLLIRSIQQLRLAADSQHPTLIPILLAHWSVSGSSLPNGLPVDQLSEPVIPWLDIDTLGWKIVAAGHIHQMQVIAEGVARTPMFYCSSAAVTSLGEIGGPHGCWIYDTEADELRFVQIEDRPFVDWTCDASQDIGGIQLLPKMPEGIDGAVVRVRYRRNGFDLTDAQVRSFVERGNPHKVFIKEIDKPTASRARLTETIADDITPADALGLWIAQTDVVASRNGDGPRFEASLRERHLGYVERLGK